MGDVDVQPEAPFVVDGPGEDGVGGAHPVLREFLRRGHHGLGHQLASVDHPPGAAVARPDVVVGTVGADVEHLEHPLDAGSRHRAAHAGHRPDTAGSATPTRRSTASWKKAMWPANRATSG